MTDSCTGFFIVELGFSEKFLLVKSHGKDGCDNATELEVRNPFYLAVCSSES